MKSPVFIISYDPSRESLSGYVELTGCKERRVVPCEVGVIDRSFGGLPDEADSILRDWDAPYRCDRYTARWGGNQWVCRLIPR